MEFFLGGLSNLFTEYTLIENAVKEADTLGFYGVLLPDHYMWGKMEWAQRADTNTTLETWIALSYLAGKTEQIKLGTLVTPIPFRPPPLLAKMLSTLDVISNGRVVLGVGAGWSQVEFEGYSIWNEARIRVDKTVEGLKLMIKLWTQNEVTFEGDFYHVKKAILEPKPVQHPYPQLLFGGTKQRMLRLAGQYGDIIYLSQFGESGAYDEMKKIVLTAAKNAKRENKIAFMAGPLYTIGPYNSEKFIKHIELAKEAGASYFLAAIPRSEKFIESIRCFAKEVIPSFK